MRLRILCVLRPSKRRPAIPKIGFMGLRQVLQSVKGSGPLPSSPLQQYRALLSSQICLSVGATSQPFRRNISPFKAKPRMSCFDIPCSIAVNWLPSFSDAPNEGRERRRQKGSPFVFCPLRFLPTSALMIYGPMHACPSPSSNTELPSP